MKTRLTLTLFLIAIVTAAHTQDVYYAWGFSKGTYNEYGKKWSYTEIEPADLKFTIQGKVIMVNDQAESVYTTGKQLDLDAKDGHNQYGWFATDEKDRRCVVKFVWQPNVKNSFRIMVMYDDVAFIYYMKQ